MIRSETEYRQAVTRIADEAQRLDQQEAKLKEMGLGSEEIRRAMDPMRSFHEQLKEEIHSYERLKRGEFGELESLDEIGQLLVAVRIAQGISQRELAGRLAVHESQVSRDERNEYHGVTLERAQKILDALNVKTRTTVDQVGEEVLEAS